jgi:hypothetical protein
MGNPRRRLGAILILSVALALASGTARAGSVFGTVLDTPTFLPLEGAWVYLVGKRAATDSVQTDSSGAFSFSGVADCGMGCNVLVRMPGFWLFESQLFLLGPDQNFQLDIQLDFIHSLAVRVVKAEDTSQALPSAQAVVTAAEYDTPRFQAADSLGKMEFRDLHTFTPYLLTVSAPGRRATTNNLRFHGPPSRVAWKVQLEIDSAHTGKTVHGTLSAKDSLPFPGARIWLSCRSGEVVADLFAQAGADGLFAIEGVPAECDSAVMHAGLDSLAVGLAGEETGLDWAIGVQRTTALRPGRARQAFPARPVWRADGTGIYDLIGRKTKPIAGRARSRP